MSDMFQLKDVAEITRTRTHIKYLVSEDGDTAVIGASKEIAGWSKLPPTSTGKTIIIFADSEPPGFVMFYDIPIITTRHVHCVKVVDPNLLPEYVFLLLKSRESELQWVSSGNIILHLAKYYLERLSFRRVHSLERQGEIYLVWRLLCELEDLCLDEMDIVKSIRNCLIKNL